MIIHVYSNMYNEAVLLPYWLRHYETIADRIFVWDAGSTDGTREILVEHPKVTLLPRENRAHHDNYYVTVLYPQYETYSRGIANWVIIADADEFVYHPHIHDILHRAQEEGIQMIHCPGYSMLSDTLPTTDGHIYTAHPMGVPDILESKWTIHTANIHIRFRVGRHGRPYNAKQFTGLRSQIKLLHYRYLTREYIENRERRNITGVSQANPQQRWSFTIDGPRTMPNGEKTPIFAWLTNHRNDVINVLEI